MTMTDVLTTPTHSDDVSAREFLSLPPPSLSAAGDSTDASRPIPTATASAPPLSSLAVRMQKKLAGRLATSKVLTKQVLPDPAAAAFDSLHALLRSAADKERAEKLVKYAMKLALKVGVLARNGLLDGEAEQERLNRVRRHTHNLCLAVISFAQVAYSYERSYIIGLCTELRDELEPLVNLQLSDKSSARLQFLFDALCSPALMDEIFRPAHDVYLKRLAADLDILIDAKDL